MQYVLKAKEMKYCDQKTIEKIGIPSLVLMERAALVTIEEIERIQKIKGNILVAAGTGNNGGDGLAIGRMLVEKGAKVTFLLVGSREKVSEETNAQIRIVENLGFSIQSKIENEEYDMIVDALFGIGLGRAVEGKYCELIEAMNRMKQKGTFICSVDIPSGICADTGKVMGCAVKADLTVSYAYAKRGHLLYPGKEYTGILKVRDIGIPKKIFGESTSSAFYYEKEDLKGALAMRRPDGNKGTFGKVLLLAGSHDMCGACLVCGESVMRTGAGMVKIISPECNREIIQKALPEAMLQSYTDEPDEASLSKSIAWADVLVAGPGVGTGEIALKVLTFCLKNSKIPIVLDADALNLISEEEALQELVKTREEGMTVMTPHPGELVRLLQTDMEKYRNDREELVEALIEKYNCVVAAKDAVTLVAEGKQREICINISGNDGMATAGSGDVLAGIIGGLLAQKMNAFDAASFGVFLHGLAGDTASEKKGKHSVMATDIVKALPEVIYHL